MLMILSLSDARIYPPTLNACVSQAQNNLHFIILFDNSQHSGVVTVFTASDDAGSLRKMKTQRHAVYLVCRLSPCVH